MAISLYDAIVPSSVQILGSVKGLIEKAGAHLAAAGGDEGALLATRLAPDMLPLAYQIKSSAEHSKGAILGVRKGVYGPDLTPPPMTFAELRDKVSDAKAFMAGLDRAEVDGFEGQDMRFEFGERRMDFTADQFLLSFTQPNFYFHATTAYAILRAQGVKIGKMDFMGRVRIKT